MSLKTKPDTMDVLLGSVLSVIRSKKVIMGNKISPADIIINDGKIKSILPWGRHIPDPGTKIVDVGELVVMAGIIDPHVHVNEPGRTDWEGYQTATLAAAAGGITTIVDMPLNSLPPTTSVSNFDTKLQAAEGNCYVDVAFWGGVIPDNQAELIPMLHAGVAGFKCFLINSGVPEFPHVNLMDLHAAMTELQGTNSVLLFHAELESKDAPVTGDPALYDTFLTSRPDHMEVAAIELVADLCLQYKVRCHIVHLSSARSLPVIRRARKAGAPITAETTHHYLTLSAENIPPGATYYKCCPPVRGQSNREALWNALLQGDIDMVVSDHSPCTPDLKLLKEGDFLRAWGGISSLQFGLSLFWSSARTRGFSLLDVSRLLSSNPAKLCSLGSHKGTIKQGYAADLVIWDPDSQFQVHGENIHHKNKITPYLGFLLWGEVVATLVRGTVVYHKGTHAPQATGKQLLVHTLDPPEPGAPYY